jgi:hypothetical protein
MTHLPPSRSTHTPPRALRRLALPIVLAISSLSTACAIVPLVPPLPSVHVRAPAIVIPAPPLPVIIAPRWGRPHDGQPNYGRHHGHRHHDRY